MLAGYRRYRFDLAESAARHIAPHWLRRGTLGLAGWLYPKADWLPRPLRAKRTLQNLATDDATAHLRSVAIAGGELPDLLLAADLVASTADHDPFDRGRQLFKRCASGELLNRLLYLDMKTLLADEILTKVDRTSMAVGLEVRTPMLDYRLVELSARLPVSLKLADGQGKRVLRNVVERWLGPDCAGTAKHGFDVPTDAWFRGPAREALCDALLSRSAICRNWIEPRATERLVRHHMTGLGNHGRTLWTLFMLEKWAQAYSSPDTFASTGRLAMPKVATSLCSK
jgi:asparagine synthase (glutamine-hydrolysing)